jgi:hypothetical protein
MLNEEKRVTVSLGKREILLFSIALLITYGLVFAFGVEFGKSWMRSLLESQEVTTTRALSVPETPATTVERGAVPTERGGVKPASPVIEVRPSAEKPAHPEPKVAEGGEPSVETPQTVVPKVTTKAEEAKKTAEIEVEKAVSAAVSTANKAGPSSVAPVTHIQKKAVAKEKEVAAKAQAVEKSASKSLAHDRESVARLKKTTIKPHLAGGEYLVQVGAFSKEFSAINLIKKL